MKFNTFQQPFTLLLLRIVLLRDSAFHVSSEMGKKTLNYKKRKKQPCYSASRQTAPVSTENRARQIPIRAPVTKEKQLLFASAFNKKKIYDDECIIKSPVYIVRRHPGSCLVFHHSIINEK
jgi:hypothetical protein